MRQQTLHTGELETQSPSFDSPCSGTRPGALLRHERIETTIPKAKELRPFVDALITMAKRGVRRATRGRAVPARTVSCSPRFGCGSRRQAVRHPGAALCRARRADTKRILRVGFRRGDSAEVAQIELVGGEWTIRRLFRKRRPRRKRPSRRAKGYRRSPPGNGQADAQRARSKGGGAKGRGQGPDQGRHARQTSTPRKAGGS